VTPRSKSKKAPPPPPRVPTPRVPTAEHVISKWQGLFDGLAHDNHTVCIVVGTAYIEHSLGALLRAHFVNSDISLGVLDPIKGALGDLAKKAKTAFSLGLISEGCVSAAETLAKIRNTIAHSTDILSFDDREIAKLCGELKVPETGPVTIVFPPLQPIRSFELDDPRKRFTFLTVMVCTYVILKANNVAKCGKITDYWDGGQPLVE
jgi:DNA-binding MltR family transcriptional regulator